MTTHRLLRTFIRLSIFILVAFLVISFQNSLQAAKEGEKDRLKTLEFKRQYSDHFRNVAEALRYSVVSVEARFTREIRDQNGKLRTIYEEGSYGSGFIFDREGHVVTDLRNIVKFPSGFISPLNPRQSDSQIADYIKITLYNGDKYQAEYVGLDGSTGLAVVKMKRINPDDMQPVVFSEVADIKIGEPVMILDYNNLSKNLLGGAFGVISAMRGQYPSLDESESAFLMVNFPKVSGNDGGIIIDVYGRVIAMVSSYTPYGESSELHYGIPVDIISKICNSLIEKGIYSRPFYGFTLLELNESIKLQEDIDFDEGMYIAYVEPDSPAENAGLVKGDVIYMWDGKILEDVSVIMNTFEKKQIGSTVEIEYFHRDFNVWDTITTEYELKIEDADEQDELERARKRARKYL